MSSFLPLDLLSFFHSQFYFCTHTTNPCLLSKTTTTTAATAKTATTTIRQGRRTRYFHKRCPWTPPLLFSQLMLQLLALSPSRSLTPSLSFPPSLDVCTAAVLLFTRQGGESEMKGGGDRLRRESGLACFFLVFLLLRQKKKMKKKGNNDTLTYTRLYLCL